MFYLDVGRVGRPPQVAGWPTNKPSRKTTRETREQADEDTLPPFRSTLFSHEAFNDILKMATSSESLNLVLLGKIGAGKSASGNTILGRQAFISKKSPTSVTRDFTVASGTACGIPVTVYDTPGVFNTDVRDEINLNYQRILQRCESGPCAFLLVIKADRFTEEERKTVEKIEELLGEERREKTWILFTRGDELEDENMTIEEFINLSEPLNKLVQKYDQRYHVFNNNKRGSNGQVTMLLAKIIKTCLNKMVKMKQKVKSPVPKTVKPDTRDSLSSRRIVLLGSGGAGKSASGNTILGQEEFTSEMSASSVTSESSEKHGTVSGRSVSVVDTPGFFDTEMKEEELKTKIAQSVYISSPGPHAFLIVFPVGRFTEREQGIPQQIEMMFGEEVLKYSIILFTHGDQLNGKSVEKLIEGNSRLRDVVQRCGGRYHVFNNEDQSNREQVKDLLQKIDTMIEQNGGRHYSNEMFQDAQRIRQEEEERRQREERIGAEKETSSGFQRFLIKHRVLVTVGAVTGAVIAAPVTVAAGGVGAAVGAVVGAAAVVSNLAARLHFGTRRRQREEEERKQQEKK